MYEIFDWLFTIAKFGFFVYWSVPIIFLIYPRILLHVLFLNYLCPPSWYLKNDRPTESYKLEGTRNFYMKSISGNNLGVWHISPNGESLSAAKKVVLYCHGNAFHRGFYHRVDLYRNLQKVGFHVVTFDYSGFGDSDGKPLPNVVIDDTISVYNWLMKLLVNDGVTVIVWGHSLGTSISTLALSKMSTDPVRKPDGLVLEAPFTTSIEASETFPISKFFLTLYPYLKQRAYSNIEQFGANLETIKHLPVIQCKIFILHAEDDTRIPFFLGEKLYETTIKNPETKSRYIKFMKVDAKYKVQHYTAQHPNICSIIRQIEEDVDRVDNPISPVYQKICV